MFHVYWPVTALVAAVIVIIALLVVMKFAGLCRARTTTLPMRPLDTYLPDNVSQGGRTY